MGILLLCFLYDAPPFQRPAATAEKKVISEAANRAREAGVVRFSLLFVPLPIIGLRLKFSLPAVNTIEILAGQLSYIQ